MLNPDNYILLKKATRYFPSPHGGYASVKTVHRWALHGVQGVLLRTIQLPGGKATTPEWLAQFIRELTAKRDGVDAPQPIDSDKQQRKVEQQLDKLGI